MKIKKYKSENFKRWLDDVGEQAPKLKTKIIDLLDNLGNGYAIEFLFENESVSGSWDEANKIISLNAKAPATWLLEDLVNILYDINNSDHKLWIYGNFPDGESYATHKVKAQYQSFLKGYEAIYNYIINNSEEAEKFVGFKETYEIWLQQISSKACLSFAEYANEENNNNFFVDDWNNWHNYQSKNLDLVAANIQNLEMEL